MFSYLITSLINESKSSNLTPFLDSSSLILTSIKQFNGLSLNLSIILANSNESNECR